MIQPLVYCIRDQISLEIYTEKGGGGKSQDYIYTYDSSNAGNMP